MIILQGRSQTPSSTDYMIPFTPKVSKAIGTECRVMPIIRLNRGQNREWLLLDAKTFLLIDEMVPGVGGRQQTKHPQHLDSKHTLDE